MPDARLAEGTRGVAELMRRWWGIEAGWESRGSGGAAPVARGRHVALAFSCGVDSFYSLFYAEPRPTMLLGVGGCDLPLSRPDLLAARREAVEAVATACGLECCWMHTTLREHPLYRAAPWDALTHGAALVSMALMLPEHIRELILSSSYHRSNLHPYGSHPDLDPLWSTSYLRVRHFDADVWRSDKLVRLVDDPAALGLVSRHLQVCWEHPTPGGNCGVCEKCVRLRLTLWRQRRGVQLETLPLESEQGLSNAVRRLGALRSPALIPPYERFLGCGTDVERALQDLLENTRRRTEGGGLRAED
jgi:hypothetical protein